MAPDNPSVHLHYGLFLMDSERNLEAAREFAKASNSFWIPSRRVRICKCTRDVWFAFENQDSGSKCLAFYDDFWQTIDWKLDD